ncbi:MAG: AP2 domain-containing protein [Verrucomicrobiales bacterium]|nr:AP2 domain-containing protein [Verrucomicrobiales bacterium]
MSTEVMAMEERVSVDEPTALPTNSAPAGGIVSSAFRRGISALASGLDWLFGFVSLVIGLAILAVIPGLNILSLGYLIEVSGRVARSGRLRDGWIGIRKASVIGSVLTGAWLVLLPVRFLAGLAEDAALIDPASPSTRVWAVGVPVLGAVALMQILWACIRGGRLRHFLWPAPIRCLRWITTSGKWRCLWIGGVTYLRGLRLSHYFWLGARGFAGAVAWLVLPVALLFAGAQLAPKPSGAAASFLGGGLLMLAALYLPFLQARFGREDQWRALFDWRAVRHDFARAPIAFLTALLITLLFALPLYLLKVELPPRELTWLPSLVFVLFGLPARFLAGWALGRAGRRQEPRHGLFRWAGRLGMVPIVLAYVLWVYFSQFVSWNGALGLLEQHAFLVPAPLLSL